jgi:hypothetical protein
MKVFPRWDRQYETAEVTSSSGTNRLVAYARLNLAIFALAIVVASVTFLGMPGCQVVILRGFCSFFLIRHLATRRLAFTSIRVLGIFRFHTTLDSKFHP